MINPVNQEELVEKFVDLKMAGAIIYPKFKQLNSLRLLLTPDFPVLVKTERYYSIAEFVLQLGGFLFILYLITSLIGSTFLYKSFIDDLISKFAEKQAEDVTR